VFVFKREAFEQLHPKRRQHRPHEPRTLLLILRLAGHLRLRAPRRLHRSARSTGLGFWAGDHGTSGSRARRAFTNLAGLVAGADAGRAGRHRRLQNIAT